MPLIGKAQWSARESFMNTGRVGVNTMARAKGQALIAELTQAYIKEVPTFYPGDTVKVYVKIKKGNS